MAFELPTLPFPRDSLNTPYIASPDVSGKYTVASGQWFKNASNLWTPVSATDPLPTVDNEVKTLLTAIQSYIDGIETALGQVQASPTAYTVLARLKDLADRLGEVSSNPTANTVLARLKTLEGYLDGVEAALGTQSDTEATGNGSLIAILKRIRTLVGQGIVTLDSAIGTTGVLVAGSDGTNARAIKTASDGTILTQLTGSTVQDSQAVPMTQAQKDIAMRAYENIINIIGIENIKLLLPMWETSGIEFTDLIRPYLKFKAEGVTLAQPGLLHPMPYFDGINDYVRQKPVTEATITNAWLSLNNSSYKIAQKLPQYALSGDIKFVMLHLQKVGDPNASIVVKLVADNSGQPTGAVLATTEPLSTSEMSTTARRQGLYFATAATALRNTVYWLVVEFSSVTTIDANNYIAVGYDSAGAYGQPIATYDGSIWTMVNGQSLRFEIYDDLLTLNQSYSYIVASALNGVDCRVISLPIGNIRYQSGGLSQGDYSTKNNIIVYPAGGGTGAINREMPLFPYPLFTIYAVSFSYADSASKMKLYINSQLIGSSNGTANAAPDPPKQPFLIGATRKDWGNDWDSLTYAKSGYIGPVIVASTVLTQAQLGQIHNQLLALRRLGRAV